MKKRSLDIITSPFSVEEHFKINQLLVENMHGVRILLRRIREFSSQGLAPMIILDFDDHLTIASHVKSFLKDWEKYPGDDFWKHIYKNQGLEGIYKCLEIYKKLNINKAVFPQSENSINIILTAGIKKIQRMKVYNTLTDSEKNTIPCFFVDNARQKVALKIAIFQLIEGITNQEINFSQVISHFVFMDDRTGEKQGEENYYPRKHLDYLFSLYKIPISLARIDAISDPQNPSSKLVYSLS